MKKIASLMLLAALLVAGTAFAADPIVGSWTLNAAKSKFSSGNELKSATRVYTEADGVYTLDQKLTGTDGKVTSWTVEYSDGKDMKQKDPKAPGDTTHAKKINAHTWDFDLKKDGKVIGHVHRVVSADGKTLTVHNKGASGDETLVFDKQ